MPPLRYRHGELAGELLKLEFDARGRLLIEARVDHALGRRCGGLSVAATIEKYMSCVTRMIPRSFTP
jgi:hypothetical protein